jgi:hypothetical protein
MCVRACVCVHVGACMCVYVCMCDWSAYGGGMFLYLYGTEAPVGAVTVSLQRVQVVGNRANGTVSGGYGGGMGLYLPADVQTPSASCPSPPGFWNWTYQSTVHLEGCNVSYNAADCRLCIGGAIHVQVCPFDCVCACECM